MSDKLNLVLFLPKNKITVVVTKVDLLDDDQTLDIEFDHSGVDDLDSVKKEVGEEVLYIIGKSVKVEIDTL